VGGGGSSGASSIEGNLHVAAECDGPDSYIGHTDINFWGGSGSVACQEFITQLGRNFQVIYEQANSHGQKVSTASNNMSSTDSAVGSSWA
jgi:hypothetical protein